MIYLVVTHGQIVNSSMLVCPTNIIGYLDNMVKECICSLFELIFAFTFSFWYCFHKSISVKGIYLVYHHDRNHKSITHFRGGYLPSSSNNYINVDNTTSRGRSKCIS